MKWNWGSGIVLSFGLFAAFVFSLVGKMISSGSDLLPFGSYRAPTEINRDIQLLSESRELLKGFSLEWSAQEAGLAIDFPTDVASASIRLTCLRNAASDEIRNISFHASGKGSREVLNLKRPEKGNWLAEIRGRAKGKEFLIREEFRIY